MNILKFIDEIIRKYPKQFFLMLMFLLIQNIFEMASILSIVPLLDIVTKPNLVGISPITAQMLQIVKHIHLPPTIYSIMAMVVSFFMIRTVMTMMVTQSMLKIKYLFMKDMICGTYKDVFYANAYFFSLNSQGYLANTLQTEVNKIGDALSTMGTMFIRLFQIVFYFTLPFIISWKLSAAVLLLGIIFAFPFSRLGKVMHKLGIINVKTGNKIFELILETLAMAKIIIGYGEQDKNITALSKVFDEHKAVSIKSQVIDKNSPAIFQLGSMIIVLLSLVLSQEVFHIPFANSAVLLYSFYTGFPYVGQFISGRNSIMSFFPSYEQVNNLQLQAKKEIQVSGIIKFNGFDKQIALSGVNFGYRNQPSLLNNIDVCIPKGKMIAFIGKSGAGKSTLIDLIMGFYSPDSGAVLVDDVDLREFDTLSWRKKLGYVPQECALFNMSLKDNLKWAKDNASDENINDACERANVNEFIKDLPSGLDTVVGDRGARLSGGQRQRVALARAILRKPEILILDEATSSLDSHSEKLIQDAIEKIANETTVIVIAHRLSTIVNADCIYVIDGGSIIEKGTFSDLCANKGHCYELSKIQGMI